MSFETATADEKPNFGGKYVLLRNENLNEFLAANGKYSKEGVAAKPNNGEEKKLVVVDVYIIC